MNVVNLFGTVGSVERKEIGDNVLLEISVATSWSKKNQSGEWENFTDWHRCNYWRDRKISKGDKVAIVGELKTDKWQDKDGNNRYKTYVQVRSLEVVAKIDPANLQPSDDLPF